MRTLERPTPLPNLTPRPHLRRVGPATWSTTRKAARQFIEWALRNQRHQCFYCGFFIGNTKHRRKVEVDHIAPKGDSLYPQWTFEPLNLVLTCSSCNSVFKGPFDAVLSVQTKYEDTTFKIVHPYLDKVEDHVTGSYKGGPYTVSIPEHRSEKGEETIRRFRLADIGYIKAINGQAQNISHEMWKLTLRDAVLTQYNNALLEVSGRA